MEAVHRNLVNLSQCASAICDGDLLLFPPYLSHEVLPNPSERERICLAFNVTVVRKGSGPAGLTRIRRG